MLIGKPEEKKPPGIPRHTWVYNIKVDIGGIGYCDMD
jgi:hypothetical protein